MSAISASARPNCRPANVGSASAKADKGRPKIFKNVGLWPGRIGSARLRPLEKSVGWTRLLSNKPFTMLFQRLNTKCPKCRTTMKAKSHSGIDLPHVDRLLYLYSESNVEEADVISFWEEKIAQLCVKRGCLSFNPSSFIEEFTVNSWIHSL